MLWWIREKIRIKNMFFTSYYLESRCVGLICALYLGLMIVGLIGDWKFALKNKLLVERETLQCLRQ